MYILNILLIRNGNIANPQIDTCNMRYKLNKLNESVVGLNAGWKSLTGPTKISQKSCFKVFLLGHFMPLLTVDK